MPNDNAQKKKEIDEVLEGYAAAMDILKQKRDRIVGDFLEVLRQKRIAELRELLK